MSQEIHLHIDRLVLDGIDPRELDADTLSTDVRLALEELLAEGGLHQRFAGGGAWDRVRGGEIATSGAQGEALGAQIARAVHAGLGNQEGSRR